VPSLSRIGRLTFAGGVGLTLGGLLGSVAPMAGAGQSVLVGLALAWVATVPLPRRMRRERLEFTWWIASRARGVRRPEEPIPLRVALRNPTDETVVLGTPRLALSPGLRHARWKNQRVVIPPRSVAALELEVRPAHAGRHLLHGAWMTISGPLGLAWAPLYFPNPLVIEVQPRAGGPAAAPRIPARTERAPRAGRATRRLGEGPELRQLREHQPGDPFKRIAWKASARRGKLLVRETEEEAQTTRVLVVDASATMRGDDRGAAKIDYAIELAAQAAKLSLAGGDRLGLVGFDARVVGHVAPGGGPAHARELVAAAMDLRTLVDEDLTDPDDDALVLTVAKYFREQEGVDVLRGVSPGEARRRLAELCARTAKDDPVMRLPVAARDPLSRVLRAFCRARALTLPLKHDTSGRAKAAGLSAAIRLAVEGARETRTLLVVSDLDPLADATGLRDAIAAARHKRHRLTFVAPAGDDFVRAPGEDDKTAPRASGDAAQRDAVRTLFARDEAARLRELRGALASLGVPLYTARARDPAARWLRLAAAPHAK
jgi:uncharacterized protein (DUF58 family)